MSTKRFNGKTSYVQLGYGQYIKTTEIGDVNFYNEGFDCNEHTLGCRDGERFTLNQEQFRNLVDYVENRDVYHIFVSICLGASTTLEINRFSKRLYDRTKKIRFTFHPESWKKFINEGYMEIKSFLDRDVVPRGERYAAGVRYTRHRPGKFPSSMWRKAVQRATRDDCETSHKQSQHPSFPERPHTNSRRYFKKRSGKDGGRIRSQIENDSTPYTSIETSDNERGRESKDEIPSASLQYSIE